MTVPQPLKLAYIGLGNMGLAIATNLTQYTVEQRLDPLIVWNRSKDKYALLPSALGVSTPEDIIKRGCNVVLASLANDAAAEEVYAKLFIAAAGSSGIIFVDQSTLSPNTAAKLAEKAKQVNAHFLAAPVLGQPPAARARTMVCTVAGDPDAVETVKPILDYLGKATIVIGQDASKGAQVKLLANMMLYDSIQVFSEVYALAEATSVSADKLHEVFQTIIPAPPLLNYSSRISRGDFDASTGFKLEGGIKDVKLMMALRDSVPHSVPLPTLERVLNNLERAKMLAGDKASERSVEALSMIAREEAGLDVYEA